jgi:hypothetical protein
MLEDWKRPRRQRAATRRSTRAGRNGRGFVRGNSSGRLLPFSPGRSGMGEDELALFHDSLERCRQGGGFLDRFYDLFVQSSEEVAAKFRETDFRRQKRVLMASLYSMMLSGEGHPEGLAHLRRIAILHDREHHAIRPELYDLWLDSLIRAVGECDPEFAPEIERVWRKLLLPGLSLMKAAY